MFVVICQVLNKPRLHDYTILLTRNGRILLFHLIEYLYLLSKLNLVLFVTQRYIYIYISVCIVEKKFHEYFVEIYFVVAFIL